MQRLQKCDESGCLCRAQVLAICGHVAAALDQLSNHLVVREAHRNGIERRTSLSTFVSERVAVVALLDLEDQRSLPLERRAVVEELGRNGHSAPCLHHGTPGRVLAEVRESSQGDCGEKNGEDRQRSAAPAFFAFTGKKWQQEKGEDRNHGADQQRGCFHRSRQVRKHGVKPKKKEIWARRCLDDGGIRRAGRAEGTEVEGANRDGKQNGSREKHVFPDRGGNEWY